MHGPNEFDEMPRGHGGLNDNGGEFLVDEYFTIFNKTASLDDIKEAADAFAAKGRNEQERYEKNYRNKPASVAEIEAALNVIPNDDVFLAELVGWGSWDAWNNIGMAIFHATNGSDEGKALYHKWSAKYDGYNSDHTNKRWEALKRSPPKDIGAGSLFFFAGKADPHWRPGTVEFLPPSQWFGERPAPIPPALVKGLLPETGVATIGGQSGTGKSFHAIHLGVRLIPDCQQNFYIDKYRIKRHGGVLYLVLEGKSAFPLRVTAAFERMLNRQMTFGESSRLPFAWNTYAPNLFEKGPDNLLRLVNREQERMRREFGVDLVAVMLDTMGLAACYENENMAAQVQRVALGLNKVSDEFGALSINVDHMGKDTDAGMRGTSAKRDCVDTILACFCDRENGDQPKNHRMQLLKVRDGEEGRVIPYRLEQVDMGMDEDGEQVTTCVVQWELNRPVAGKKGVGRPKKQTDINIERAIREVDYR